MSALPTVRTIAALRETVGAWRKDGGCIGLVPTMGALHEGHLALVRAARAACDRVVATIFVNPAQFGPSEDFQAYPRDEAADAEKLAALGVHLLFAPPVEEVYPPGFATTVTVSGVSDGLCGDHRPGHFDGVATVVSKLLLQALPDRAYFGEKDYQQLQVIKRMVKDLDIPVTIEGVAIVRDPDGLALSSRNLYLSPDERRVAAQLNQVLQAIATAVAAGASGDAEAASGRDALIEAGFESVDYLEVRDAETLAPVDHPEHPARVFAAARIGRTRLIDNMPVPTA